MFKSLPHKTRKTCIICDPNNVIEVEGGGCIMYVISNFNFPNNLRNNVYNDFFGIIHEQSRIRVLAST